MQAPCLSFKYDVVSRSVHQWAASEPGDKWQYMCNDSSLTWKLLISSMCGTRWRCICRPWYRCVMDAIHTGRKCFIYSSSLTSTEIYLPYPILTWWMHSFSWFWNIWCIILNYLSFRITQKNKQSMYVGVDDIPINNANYVSRSVY